MNVLITGGTSAVGRQLVQMLASQGHHVIFTYCNHGEVAGQLCARWDHVMMRQVDFTRDESVAALTEEIPALNIDVLVNNAYVGRPLGTHFYRTQVVDFEESFRVNVAPVIQITQACIAAMRRKKSGLIITVGTLAARGLPPAGYSVYVATKAYLQQLARCWQSEYSHLGILSMTVLPDFMPTPLHGEMVDHLAEKELQGKSRLLMPEEVAQCISETISDTKLFTQERIVTVN